MDCDDENDEPTRSGRLIKTSATQRRYHCSASALFTLLFERLAAHTKRPCTVLRYLLSDIRGVFKSFVTRFDTQMTQAKFLCYY